jgi:hypothetical protein
VLGCVRLDPYDALFIDPTNCSTRSWPSEYSRCISGKWYTRSYSPSISHYSYNTASASHFRQLEIYCQEVYIVTAPDTPFHAIPRVRFRSHRPSPAYPSPCKGTSLKCPGYPGRVLSRRCLSLKISCCSVSRLQSARSNSCTECQCNYNAPRQQMHLGLFDMWPIRRAVQCDVQGTWYVSPMRMSSA